VRHFTLRMRLSDVETRGHNAHPMRIVNICSAINTFTISFDAYGRLCLLPKFERRNVPLCGLLLVRPIGPYLQHEVRTALKGLELKKGAAGAKTDKQLAETLEQRARLQMANYLDIAAQRLRNDHDMYLQTTQRIDEVLSLLSILKSNTDLPTP